MKWTAGILCVALIACGDDDDASTSADGGVKPKRVDHTVTYQRDIRAALESNCVECHTAGGIGPSRLDDWPTVQSLGGAIVAAVGTGIMPPWPASDQCHPIADSRALPQATKDLFAQWQTDGFQEGNAADYVEPPKRHRLELGPPSISMMGDASFTPGVNADTYRCFFIGTVPEDTYITALDIVPTIRSEVHHVQLHRVNAADVAAVRDKDLMEEGGGYGCNTAGVGGFVQSQNMFSYRPGAVAVVLGDGDAVYLQKGSGLILQMHYNTQFLPTGELPQPDQTRVDMWTMPAGQVPTRVIYRTGVLSPLNGNNDGGGNFLALLSSIPADNPHVVGESTLPMSSVSVIGAGINSVASSGTFIPGEIVGMTPHAHAWATRMVASLKPATGAEQCLVEVPNWDYNWQLDYLFDKGLPYSPTDMLHVECDYDNTAANQPVINGTRRPVKNITFGENTLNEMCLHYLWLRFSYADFKAANP